MMLSTPNRDWEESKQLIRSVVQQAADLKDKYTDEIGSPVHWCCIFTQSDTEYNHLVDTFQKHGIIARNTTNGPVYVVPPIPTVSGDIRVIKVRMPDPTRTERGDADFASQNYERLKSRTQTSSNIRVILKVDFEMVELMEPGANVRVYFSNPPIKSHPDIKAIIDQQDASLMKS